MKNGLPLPSPPAAGANRTTGRGQCGMGARLRVARAALHTGRNPAFAGERGAGAVFFPAARCTACFARMRRSASAALARRSARRSWQRSFAPAG